MWCARFGPQCLVPIEVEQRRSAVYCGCIVRVHSNVCSIVPMAARKRFQVALAMLMVLEAHCKIAHARAPDVKEARNAGSVARLMIDTAQVKLDGTRIAATRSLAATPQTELIEPLNRALKARGGKPHANAPSTLVLKVAASVPFRVVRKVLFSAAHVGYSTKWLIVDGAIVELATSDAGATRREFVGVWVKRDGYVYGYDSVVPIAKSGRRYDTVELGRRLSELRKKWEPELNEAMVFPNDFVRMDDVASTMKAAVSAGFPIIGVAAEDSPRRTRGIYARGILSKQAIRAVIGTGIGDVRACYLSYRDRMQRVGAVKEGRIIVEFVVDESGKVRTASLQSGTFQDAELEDCVLSVIRSLVFPAPPAGVVVVKYPFVLGTQAAPEPRSTAATPDIPELP